MQESSSTRDSKKHPGRRWLQSSTQVTKPNGRHLSRSLRLQSNSANLITQKLRANGQSTIFGRDPDTGGPTACDSVWNAVTAAHKGAANYRHKILPLYEECTYIFTGKSATGKYAISSVYTTPDVPFKAEKKRNHEDSWVDDEPQDTGDEEIPGTQSSRKTFSAFDDCGSSVEDSVLAVKKPVKWLPSKDGYKKIKAGSQDEVLKLLNVIASNQDKLVKHHTAPSDLAKAIALFKAEHSDDLDAGQRSKFQMYLKENCGIFILQDEEERNESMRECLN